MPSSTRARKTASAPKAAAAPITNLASSAAEPMLKVAQQLRRWTDTVLGLAGPAGELSLNLARLAAPRQQVAIDKAASLLRQARETAGMTTQELGRALDLNDLDLLRQAELGKAALPMEIILRLASVLGRHDPATFAMKLARSYNPALWKALDDLGIGRMVALVGRERELANLYRANDAARSLSDADFADVLAFVKTGFDMSVKFRVESAARAAPRAARPAAK